MLEFQKHVMANIEWVSTDDLKYEVRSREAFLCEKKHPEDETEPMAYLYRNAEGHLYLHCHRCGFTISVAQFADVVFPN